LYLYSLHQNVITPELSKVVAFLKSLKAEETVKLNLNKLISPSVQKSPWSLTSFIAEVRIFTVVICLYAAGNFILPFVAFKRRHFLQWIFWRFS